MAFSDGSKKAVYLFKYCVTENKAKGFPRRNHKIVQKAQIKKDICAGYHVQ